MLTTEEINDLLKQSGVFNEYTHCENGVPVTYITSSNEIEKFIRLLYEKAYYAGQTDSYEGGV